MVSNIIMSIHGEGQKIVPSSSTVSVVAALVPSSGSSGKDEDNVGDNVFNRAT